jgi:dipeptide/tripeptide permease
MIGYVYHNGKSNTANQDLGVKVSHSIGTFVGQLLFGWLGDVVGRKRMYGIELVRSFLSSFLFALSFSSWSIARADDVVSALIKPQRAKE